MSRPLAERLAPLATAGAVVALALSLARHHPDAATSVESGFLALLLALALPALALARRSAPVVVGGGSLIALALCLPAAEGTRGALVAALLVATAAAVTWRALALDRLTVLDCAALAVAWQCILRSARLLDLDWTPRTAVWLIALPLVAAVATWWHSRRTEERTAPLVLLAAVAFLGPGLGVVAVAVLVIAAALARGPRLSWPAASIAAVASIVAIGWTPAAAPMLLVLIAGLATARAGPIAWLPGAACAVWASIALANGGSVIGLGWLLILAPCALLAPRASRPLLLAALALALVQPAATSPALLAPALALAVAALPERTPRRLQLGWIVLALSCVALTAAYPWLRGSPVAARDLLTVPVLLLGSAAVLAMVSSVGLLRRRSRLPAWVTPLALFTGVALTAAAPRPQRLNDQPVVLTDRHAAWTAEQPSAAARTLIVDSFLSSADAVSAGQPVAWVLLTAEDGRRQRLVLRKAVETADWAARSAEGPSRPKAWLTWYAGDGRLAQRYRARWDLAPPFGPQRVEIARAGGLPPEVEIAVLSVATR